MIHHTALCIFVIRACVRVIETPFMVGIIAIINCIYIYISEAKLVHANKVWINKVLLYCIRASGEFLTEG